MPSYHTIELQVYSREDNVDVYNMVVDLLGDEGLSVKTNNDQPDNYISMANLVDELDWDELEYNFGFEWCVDCEGPVHRHSDGTVDEAIDCAKCGDTYCSDCVVFDEEDEAYYCFSCHDEVEEERREQPKCHHMAR